MVVAAAVDLVAADRGDVLRCLLLWDLLLLGPWSPPRPVDVDDGGGIGIAIQGEHGRRLVGVLPEVQLQAVAVLGGVGTVITSILIYVGVGLEVPIEMR